MTNVFIVMMFLLSILLIGVGYGLWSDTLKANVYIHMFPGYLEIGSWKVFARYRCDGCLGYDLTFLSPSNDTLHILIGSRVVEYLWIGLVIENNKEASLYLENMEVKINDTSGEYELTPISYLYEPVKTGIGYMPYWGGVRCSDLPVNGYLAGYPVLVKPGYKMVAWLYVELGLSNAEITVEIVSGY
ncbi:MAG: hypothetical protein ACPLSM_04590 [Thermosphaera sp.]